jgi:copper-containing nitrite reductase
MAAKSDKRIGKGEARALEGVPLGIKDLFATKGVHTQAASHILDSFKPEYESTVTSNLWRDGAVMLGKLNMDEFAMGSSNETSYYGPVINPWRAKNSNAQLVPGGSSGGSASAVSAWLCSAATATDTGGSIRQPAALTGTVHDIDLVMTEQLMTVATGFQQLVWTFGGTVPGPVIRVKVGDTIRVHLKNPIENAMAHSIDFHASQVAWTDEMRSIAPGEALVYESTAEYAGVWMYHCGTSPTLHHIANGMYGMVIVEPAEGLPPVDAEFALVQSEWYLGPQGEPASLEKAMAAAPAPDLVVFNGVANQYKDAPLEVGTGERVRFFILNAGPSVDSSFHIVGTIFDTVIREGVELRRGNDGSWGSQAVDLSPAQGAIIELTTAEDGLYPIVTHAFNFVGRGALGLLQAGDGDPAN